MYTLASEVLEQEELPFDLLLPLIRETAARAQRIPPAATQTGPAARGDAETVKRHLEWLKENEEMKAIYKLLSERLGTRYKK
jgi:predicted short-subunit dehydrogenase-like oxidoreductase (DUF2520 family)